MNILKQLFWTIVLLNIADAMLTYQIIYYGAEEGNMFVNSVMEVFGVVGGLAITKIIPLTMLWYFLFILYNKSAEWIKYSLYGLAGVYSILIVYSVLALNIVARIAI